MGFIRNNPEMSRKLRINYTGKITRSLNYPSFTLVIMVMTSMYSLSMPGQPSIEISQDELRSLLSEIEAQLHNSPVYRRALATVQKLLGDSSDQAKLLFKAVGREAIGVAFRQLSLHSQTVTDTTPEVEENTEISTESSSDLSECLTIVKASPTTNSIEEETLVQTAVANTTTEAINKQDSGSPQNPLKWLNSKRTSKAQIAKQAKVEQRLEKFREIGQQLKQARESRIFV